MLFFVCEIPPDNNQTQKPESSVASHLGSTRQPHLFSFPLGMTDSRSALFRSLQTYVFLLVMPADAVLFCRATQTSEQSNRPSSVQGSRATGVDCGEGRAAGAGTHARAGGDTFPAVWDVGLVGVVGVAQQRAGGRSASAPRGAGFTELDSAFFLGAVVCRRGLTPLWVSHSWRGVLTSCTNTPRE